jgi:hypothetical protein
MELDVFGLGLFLYLVGLAHGLWFSNKWFAD